MKIRELILIILGIVLIGGGVSLLTLYNAEQSESVFFIFPFIFFVTSGVGAVVGILLIIAFIIIVIFNQFSIQYLSQISIVSCYYCEEQIHQEYDFCPRCGKQVIKKE